MISLNIRPFHIKSAIIILVNKRNKDQVCAFIRDIFIKDFLLEDLNRAWVVLIYKVSHSFIQLAGIKLYI